MSQYRIVFEPKGAFWCIEIQRFAGLFWQRVRTSTSADCFADQAAGVGRTVKSFPTFTEARTYVQQIGLDYAYDDRTGPPPVARMVEPAVYQRRVPA